MSLEELGIKDARTQVKNFLDQKRTEPKKKPAAPQPLPSKWVEAQQRQQSYLEKVEFERKQAKFREEEAARLSKEQREARPSSLTHILTLQERILIAQKEYAQAVKTFLAWAQSPVISPTLPAPRMASPSKPTLNV